MKIDSSISISLYRVDPIIEEKFKKRLVKIKMDLAEVKSLVKQFYHSSDIDQIIEKLDDPRLEDCSSLEEIDIFLNDLSLNKNSFAQVFSEVIKEINGREALTSQFMELLFPLKVSIFQTDSFIL